MRSIRTGEEEVGSGEKLLRVMTQLTPDCTVWRYFIIQREREREREIDR